MVHNRLVDILVLLDLFLSRSKAICSAWDLLLEAALTL
jgi:hypothetical protein